MNPFRSRKKSQAGMDGRPTFDDPPAVPSSRGMTFRRKKTKPEQKKEIDLSTALPSLDEFRTSLLMPNLSARFSMLRDQDDPNSEDQPNDDGVLHPNRHNLYDHSALADIAEVASLAGSIRPPFAYGRSHSVASNIDGYGTDDDSMLGGSVMGRAKPGQGNKFFGGRQKIYKIPVGSASMRDVSTPDGGEEIQKPMGKAVYDDDVAMSAFQAMRAREKQDRKDVDGFADDRHGEDGERRGSPPLQGYNRNRETGSSTTSTPFDARTSTAATSVASQSNTSLYNGATSASTSTQSVATAKPPPGSTPMDRPGPKNKRLYGQGLDQHMLENQSSAMNRLDSIQRSRGNGTGLLANMNALQSRSASNLHDRFQRSQPAYSPTHFRAGSPPLTAETPNLGGFDFGTSDERSPMASRDNNPAFGRSPPLSPPMSPATDNPAFIAALEPNDLGKATASGVFNKPKTSYNEQQFAQRQLQLQEGRETPPLRAFSRTDVYQDQHGRLRNDSIASMQSAQSSRMFQLSQKSSVQDLGAVYESPKKPRPVAMDPSQATHGTFLSGLSGSEADSDPPSPPGVLTVKPSTYQGTANGTEHAARNHRYMHDDQHPAFQHGNSDGHYMDATAAYEPEPRARGSDVHGGQVTDHGLAVDSPTLGDGTNSGLNGMIRTHLRTDSGQSSVYPSSPPLPGRRFSQDTWRTADRDSVDGTYRDQEQWDQGPYGSSDPTPQPAEADAGASLPLSVRARQILEQATQLRNASGKAEEILGPVGASKPQQVLGGEAPRRSNESANVSWQEQLKAHHTRAGSTETQKERDDFASELADRRQRVQDNLKSFVDTDGREPGHAPARSPGAFGLLRKASREAMAGRGDASNKAMKMLGLGMNGSPNPSQAGISSQGSRDNLFGGEAHDHARSPNGYGRGVLPSSRIPEPSQKHASPRAVVGAGQASKERSIGTERREKFAARGSPVTRSPALEQMGQIRPRPELPGQAPSASASRQRSPNPGGVVARARADIAWRDAQAVSYHPAAHSRKYSPPRDALSTHQHASRSRSNSKTSPMVPTAPFPASSPYQSSYPAPVGQPRNAPVTPGATPSVHAHEPSYYATSSDDFPFGSPNLVPSSTFPGMNANSSSRLLAVRKRSINKQDISEPQFISSTSSVTTVDLPPEASLQNGMDEVRAESQAPPVPPFNPRRGRKAQATQNVLTAFVGRPSRAVEPFPVFQYGDPAPQYRQRKGSNPVIQANGMPIGSGGGMEEPYEERSTFSADESEPRPKPRTRLRKSSSEGGSMAAKARQQALMAASPALPSTPTFGGENEGKRIKGGMF